ncbi:hypothetical protein [Polaromonas sp.]|uniref:hypothetical protein n=1 Tax=Polaromonas sp. TaxID=1869339 RepID=UPI0025F23F05|nr:hypothetical protein [Polaromonas sp.]
MLPPLTDLVALLGIDLVLCAGCLRLLSWRRGVTPWVKGVTAACFVLMWLPLGAAQLPLVAYVRGISSDLSITLLVLACLGLVRRLRGQGLVAARERMALHVAVAAAALFLYPMALGWGDWDPYRAGWGAPGMLIGLLAVTIFFWIKGLRLLPVLVALALFAWTFDLLESTNLWDYLLDPWVAAAAIFQCVRWGAGQLQIRWRQVKAPSSAGIPLDVPAASPAVAD